MQERYLPARRSDGWYGHEEGVQHAKEACAEEESEENGTNGI
jgi:hypothetical protein